MLLFSFEFRLDLDDLNAHFTFFDEKSFFEIVTEEFKHFSKEDIELFVKKIIKDDIRGKVNSNYLYENMSNDIVKKFIKAFKKFTFFLYVYE